MRGSASRFMCSAALAALLSFPHSGHADNSSVPKYPDAWADMVVSVSFIKTPDNPIIEHVLAWGEMVSQDRRQEYQKVLNDAYRLVQTYPPKDSNHLFSWKGDRRVLAGKKVVFLSTDSSDPILEKYRKLGQLSPDTDAFVRALGNSDALNIFVGLLLDKIFVDENGKKRPDCLERAATALAHEVYGNVTSWLERDITNIKSAPDQSVIDAKRKREEIRSFQAGIDFVERLMRDDYFTKLSPAMQEGFRQALERQRRGLASWSN